MIRPAVVAALFLGLASPLYASFEDEGFSARAVAMGGAFTAMTGDPAAVFYNPAGIAFARHVSLSLNALRQFNLPAGFTDQSQANLVAVAPVSVGVLGLSEIYDAPLNYSSERTTQFSYATQGLWQAPGDDLEAGGNLKFLDAAAATGGASDMTVALDMGAVERFHDKYAAGVSILNLSGGRVGGVKPPVDLRAGVSESVRDMTFVFDVAHEGPSGLYREETSAGAGLERWWETVRHGAVAARLGLRAGDRDQTWSMGLGWKIMGGEADYALTIPLKGAARLGNALSVSWRFGASDPEAEFERMLKDETDYRGILLRELEAAENKQWQLSQQLNALRDEIKVLDNQLLNRTISEAEARKRLGDLQQQYQDSLQKFQSIQDKEKRLREKSAAEKNTPQILFEKDWSAYQQMKSQGAADSALIEDLKSILRQYQGTGVDLSQANQELVRLLQNR
ncbi:MAG TPA: hypothetical protein VNK24_06225 [Elusimicrobiota bacterium]|nr:hypothetical protein [Elusimicrobiota bacterium]